MKRNEIRIELKIDRMKRNALNKMIICSILYSELCTIKVRQNLMKSINLMMLIKGKSGG
jgi:hypothetical protein